MAALATGIRTLTFTVTDPQVGDTISFSVYLTTTNSATATPAYTGATTASQTTTASTAGTPLTFAPSVNVGSTGQYYAWVVMTLTTAAGVTTTTVYAQAALTTASPYDLEIISGYYNVNGVYLTIRNNNLALPVNMSELILVGGQGYPAPIVQFLKPFQGQTGYTIGESWTSMQLAGLTATEVIIPTKGQTATWFLPWYTANSIPGIMTNTALNSITAYQWLINNGYLATGFQVTVGFSPTNLPVFPVSTSGTIESGEPIYPKVNQLVIGPG